jgi:hypothetical protein
MPPIFPPRSNMIARASLLVLPLLLAIVVGLLVWWLHSPAFNKVGVQVEQPVQFPHSMHVAVVGLNCRFCHDAVDKSSFADLPPTQTCMGCHSQIKTDSALLAPVRASWESGEPIEWNRVNSVPDHVFFNHAIHVNKGVACETCHGRMDTAGTAVKAETFYMAWCLECHRDPAKYIRPVERVYDAGYTPAEDQKVLGARLVEEYNIKSSFQLTNCSICHR